MAAFSFRTGTAVALSFSILSACGSRDGDVPDVEEPAFGAEAGLRVGLDEAGDVQEVDPVCDAYHRIYQARSDTPPFSSLTAADNPEGALMCETRSSVTYPTLWDQDFAKTAHVCTLYEAPVATPRETGAAQWAPVQSQAHACFAGWSIGAAGARDDSEVGGRTSRTINEPGQDPITTDEGYNLLPIVFEWRYQPDPAAERPGHEIVYYVIAR